MNHFGKLSVFAALIGCGGAYLCDIGNHTMLGGTVLLIGLLTFLCCGLVYISGNVK